MCYRIGSEFHIYWNVRRNKSTKLFWRNCDRWIMPYLTCTLHMHIAHAHTCTKSTRIWNLLFSNGRIIFIPFLHSIIQFRAHFHLFDLKLKQVPKLLLSSGPFKNSHSINGSCTIFCEISNYLRSKILTVSICEMDREFPIYASSWHQLTR